MVTGYVEGEARRRGSEETGERGGERKGRREKEGAGKRGGEKESRFGDRSYRYRDLEIPPTVKLNDPKTV